MKLTAGILLASAASAAAINTGAVLANVRNLALEKLTVAQERQLQGVPKLDPEMIKKAFAELKEPLEPCLKAYGAYGFIGCTLEHLEEVLIFQIENMPTLPTGIPSEEDLAAFEAAMKEYQKKLEEKLGGDVELLEKFLDVSKAYTAPTSEECGKIFASAQVQCLAKLDEDALKAFAKGFEDNFAGKEEECSALKSAIEDPESSYASIGLSANEEASDQASADQSNNLPSEGDGNADVAAVRARLEKLSADCEAAEPGVTSTLTKDFVVDSGAAALAAPALAVAAIIANAAQ